MFACTEVTKGDWLSHLLGIDGNGDIAVEQTVAQVGISPALVTHKSTYVVRWHGDQWFLNRLINHKLNHEACKHRVFGGTLQERGYIILIDTKVTVGYEMVIVL